MDTRNGRVGTLAGSGEKGAQDGPANEATFAHPKGLAATRETVFVADRSNNKLRAVDIKTG